MKNKQTMKQLVALLVIACIGCSSENNKLALVKNSTEKISEELLTLEHKWLEAEFKLDTAYISTLIDSTFIGVSGKHISTKQEELDGMYRNISSMRSDNIFLDSLKLEDGQVNVYENTAVVTFIIHTYKKDKGQPIEKRTRFYDVWVNRNGKWKAVAAQGTVVE
jgi:hypothetical protein